MLDDIQIIEAGWVCDCPMCKKELLAWNRIKKVYAEALKPSHNNRYAAALEVWQEFKRNDGVAHTLPFDWYCKERLNAKGTSHS